MPSAGPWAQLAALAFKVLSAPEDLTAFLLGSDTLQDCPYRRDVLSPDLSCPWCLPRLCWLWCEENYVFLWHGETLACGIKS